MSETVKKPVIARRPSGGNSGRIISAPTPAPGGKKQKAFPLEGGRLWDVGPESFRHGLTPCQLHHRGSQGGQKACHCEEAQRADVAIRNPRPLAPLLKGAVSEAD